MASGDVMAAVVATVAFAFDDGAGDGADDDGRLLLP